MREPRDRTPAGHLRTRDLADLRDGLLGDARRAAAEAHLGTGCARCVAARDRLAGALDGLRGGPLPEVPRDAIRSATRLFAAQRWKTFFDAAAEFVGRLVTDQRTSPVLAIRGAAGEGRRLRFEAGTHEFDVQVVERGTRTSLRGIVLRQDGADAPVSGELTLWRDGRPATRAPLDAEGGFRFDGLAPGTYALSGAAGAEHFRLPPVVLGTVPGAGRAVR